MAGCRRTAFEEIDRPMLRPLPQTHYELANFKVCKIGINYHAEYDGFFYSVPYEHRGKECMIRATRTTIEIFVRGERIWAHSRRRSGNRYVTLSEHLPEQHKVVSEWNDDRFIDWASKFGEKTTAYIKALLNSTEHSVQAYRACMGVLRQTKGIPCDVVEAASSLALENKQFSSKYFGVTLKLSAKATDPQKPDRVIEHENIRGAAAFTGGEHGA
jgi:hypothetical protein